MVNRKISDDLKEVALRMKNRAYTTKEVLKIVDFSRSTLQRAKRRKLLTGSAAKAQAIGRGRPPKLLHCDCQYLLALAHHKSTLFLDEYAQCLEDGHYIAVSLATIHRIFACAGLNVK
jgi:transposase